MSHLLGESLDVPDYSGLRQLIENAPEEFGTVLEEERSTADFRGVSAGQFTGNVTFMDNADDLESGNRTSTSSKNGVRVSSKRKALGAEVEIGSVFHPKLVASEIGDGIDKGSVALRSGIEKGNDGHVIAVTVQRKLCLISDCRC